MLRFKRSNTKIWAKALSKKMLRALAVFILSLSVLSCENSISDIENLSDVVDDLPASTSKNVKIQFSDSAITKINLYAPVLDRYLNSEIPYNLMKEGLRIEFLNSLGEIEAQVKCNYAVHYPKRDILELSQDVEIFNIDGDLLNSEEVIWNSKTQKISSDNFVKITTANEIIYGDGFIANQDFTNYQISHIKGIISIDEEDEDL